MKPPFTSKEVAPGLLVVLYDNGTVEIASNHELPERSTAYGGPGNVFMPLHLFTRLQDFDFPRAYPKLPTNRETTRGTGE